MITPFWQMDVMFIETVIILPIYIILLVDISICQFSKTHFQSQYYVLVVSQGIADILTSLFVLQLFFARYFQFGNEFIFAAQMYGSAIFHSDSGPFFFVIRYFGVFLITLQRYLAVCRSHGRFYQIFSRLSNFQLILIHWLGSILIFSPSFFTIFPTPPYFSNSTELFLVNSAFHVQFFSAIVIFVFVFFGIINLLMYIQVIRAIIKAKKVSGLQQNKNNSSQETRLLIHIFLLVLISSLTFLYYFNEFIASGQSSYSEARRFHRRFYAIIAVNFGYINPIVLLFLNRDVRMRIGRATKVWDKRTSMVSK
ncbi:unnamed protein product [Caenorhabditis angaria]|uniref:G-protein coupled receptors family 1 profile domain-containing protein n=1 Tax=Caenorhabditis angaria TaxID=860376 RepID=A0A9P1IXW6_9PELO|nr:unnamed protein product [Caenorhabditis angaria]